MRVWVITLTDIDRGDYLVESEAVFASMDVTTATRKFLGYKEAYADLINDPAYVYEEGQRWFSISEDGYYNENHVYVALTALEV